MCLSDVTFTICEDFTWSQLLFFVLTFGEIIILFINLWNFFYRFCAISFSTVPIFQQRTYSPTT